MVLRMREGRKKLMMMRDSLDVCLKRLMERMRLDLLSELYVDHRLILGLRNSNNQP